MSDPLLNVMKIMLLAGLYLFFVRVLWAVYNELRDPRTRVARKAEAQFPAGGSVSPGGRAAQPTMQRQSGSTAVMVGQLTVVKPKSMAGTTYALANELTIGRAPTCGINVDDSYVSQVHARIFFTNGTFFVEDLDSSNGTTLNNQALMATTALAPGDLLEVGATVMEFS